MKRPAETPIPAALNLTLCLVFVAAALATLVWASRAWSGPEVSWLSLAGSIVVFSLIFNTGFALIHEAEHFALHPSRGVNEGLGVVLSALFPGAFSLLRSAHLVHHGSNRNERELIDFVRPGEHTGRKTLRYYLAMAGAFWVGTPLLSLGLCCVPGRYFGPQGRATDPGSTQGFLAFLEDINPHRIRLETACVLGVWVLLSSLLHLAWIPVLLLYLVAGSFWSSQQFIYHVGTPRHLVEGSRNLRMWAPIQWLYLHYNFHLTHHRQPHTPWVWLPAVTEVPPTQPYFRTWFSLLRTPPRPIAEAWPRDFQARGSLPKARAS
jgi:fatty acid desaturase